MPGSWPACRDPGRPRRLSRPVLTLAAAAAVLLAAYGLWRGSDRRGAGPQLPLAGVDQELLEHLDVLERWDLLFHEDLDVLLASLDPVSDELMNLRAAEEEDR